MSEADDKSVRSRRRSSFAGTQATWLRFLPPGLRPRDSALDDSPPSPAAKRASLPAADEASDTKGDDKPAKDAGASNENAKEKAKEKDKDTKPKANPKPGNPAPPSAPAPAAAQTMPAGPPASAHDAVVAPFVRPAPERSQSSPALGAPAHAVPPLASPAPPAQVEDSRPVSSMLDGALEPSGTRVTRALGSQIEAVLAAQEEIGKRHLALEGWRSGRSGRKDAKDKEGKEGKEGTAKDGKQKEGKDGSEYHELERRAQGVEDIMARVSFSNTSPSASS